MMFNHNEGDILEQTIRDALKHVDELLVVDDRSTDNSWEIIKGYKSKLAYINRYSPAHAEYPPEMWQRQHLLDKIKQMYGTKDTWVQIIESDIMILDTCVRTAISTSNSDIMVTWFMLNATRKSWDGYDNYPEWKTPIRQVMDYGYVFERTLYTFRPLPGIRYTRAWRPFPQGFERYGITKLHRLDKNPSEKSSILRGSGKAPLLAHFSHRGPKHYACKKGDGKEDRWFGDQPMLNSGKCEVFPLSRQGWDECRLNPYRNKGCQLKGL